MKRKFLPLLGFAALTGCVSPEMEQKMMDSQVQPTGADKAAVIKYVKDTFFDPYSIRDVTISNVITSPTQPEWRAVCVRMNAKNRMGGYTGQTYTSIRMKDGVAVSSLTDALGCMDGRLKFYPFPELEAV